MSPLSAVSTWRTSRPPECFHIEEALRKTLSIPVFHDDQHDTAIISGAALLNALEIVGKPIEKVRVVINGAGASGTACAEHYIRLGVKRENLILCDSLGAIHKGRTTGMNRHKERFARATHLRTVAEAMKGADVFLGCSVRDAVSRAMVQSMAPRPSCFRARQSRPGDFLRGREIKPR